MNLFAAINKLYQIRLQKKYEWKKNHVVLNSLFGFIKLSLFIVIINGCYLVTTPLFKDAINYGIDNYTGYSSRLDVLSESINNAVENNAKSLLKVVENKVKNPALNGIIFSVEESGVQSVYPRSMLRKDMRVMNKYLLQWVSEQGYDSAIFGDCYIGMNGTLYWTDGENIENDTNMELIINTMKERGCRKIFSFINNVPKARYFSRDVRNYTIGTLNYREVQKYRFKLCGYDVLENGKVIEIVADNFHIECYNSSDGDVVKILTVKTPEGKTNNTVEYDHTIPTTRKIRELTNDSFSKVKAIFGFGG